MKRHEKNGVVYLTFEHFDKYNIRHCFSTRIGGVSEGYFESVNLSFSRGDIRNNVEENFNRICGAVGFDASELVFSDQVHKTNIYKVSAADKGKGFYRDSDIKEIDGLMTNEEGVVLTTFYADCVPLYFFDRLNRVIALSHAGWKGTLNEIGRITVETMIAEYGSKPIDIFAGIGPSICGGCFEVGEDVAEGFAGKLPWSSEFVKKGEKQGKYYMDLWQINRRILLESGLSGENIEISGLCTMCDTGTFFSHRKMGSNRGSLAAFMSL